MHSMPDLNFAILKFKSQKDTKKATQQMQQSIYGHSVTVKGANRRDQKSYFAELNDDCVTAVLRLLDLKDMSSFANTCTRFRGLARAEFANRYKDETIVLQNTNRFMLDIIRNFGSQLKDMTLYAIPESTHRSDFSLLTLVAIYCVSLKVLHLRSFKFLQTSNCRQIVRFAGRLRKLVLRDCELTDRLFVAFDVPSLILKNVGVKITDAAPCEFARMQMLSLLCSNYEHDDHWRFLDLINNSKGMRFLECQNSFNRNLEKIGSFENLTVLSLYQEAIDMDTVIDVVKRLTKLNKLRIGDPVAFNAHHLWQLIRNNRYLSELLVLFTTRQRKCPMRRAHNSIFDEMLSLLMAHGRELDVILIGQQIQLLHLAVIMPPNAPMAINCMKRGDVHRILNVAKVDRLTEAEIDQIRDHFGARRLRPI